MTSVVEYFCDFCNPSRQRRTPGDENSTGYARAGYDEHTKHMEYPTGWWEKDGRHACPDCIVGREGVVEEMQHRGVRERDEAPRRTSWPSVSSPFGAQERAEVGADVGRADGGSVGDGG